MARYTYIPLKTYLDTYTSDPPPTPTLPPFCTKNGEIGVNTPISPFVKYAYLSLVKYAYCFLLVNTAMNILQFSPCKLWRSRTTSIWLRFWLECTLLLSPLCKSRKCFDPFTHYTKKEVKRFLSLYALHKKRSKKVFGPFYFTLII